MLFRNKKENDLNEGKWVGVGGKFLPGETPEQCLLREVKEETGLTLTGYRLCGIIRFVSDIWEDEDMYLYAGEDFSGKLQECSEGTLAWIPRGEVMQLPLWEGDRYFLEPLLAGAPEINMTVVYRGDELAAVTDEKGQNLRKEQKMNWTIKEFTEAGFDNLSEEELDCLHELYCQLEDDWNSSVEDIKTALQEVRKSPLYTLLCVYDGPRMIATASLTRCFDLTADARFYYNMENFVVDQAYRGRGVGKYLLRQAEEYVKAHNGRYINFTSSSSRREAHAFYRAMGYDPDYVKGFKKRFPAE